MVLATLWWLFFWTAIGLCVGSFLNVVIYRLPRERSLRSPLWSACPHCSARIRWYDNLPLVSYLLLRGRCRACGGAISPRYVIVEAAMAVVVLLLMDAFFIGQVRAGLTDSPFGLTEQMILDWPIFVAHIVLFACLLSMSAIDLEHYWVDIRFTNLAVLAGFALHVLWTPPHSAEWMRPADGTALMALLAVAGLGLVWVVRICRPHEDEEDFAATTELVAAPAESAGEEGEAALRAVAGCIELDSVQRLEEDATATLADVGGVEGNLPGVPLRKAGAGVWPAVLPPVVLLAALFGVLFYAETQRDVVPFVWRSLIPLGLLFALVAREGSVVREADQQIVEALHEERFGARAMVFRELWWLLPAIGLGAVGIWLMSSGSEIAGGISEVLHGHTRIWNLSMMRRWAPLEGLATAAAGYVIAGAIGWAVRIVFTVAFGKEAFGTGDIHLMAAAGCVAGWPVVLLGFFLTCGLALLGWVVALPFKRSRALPLGPWLSLSFLIVVIYYNRILEWEVIERMLYALDVLIFRPLGWGLGRS